jgi:hypothetical protein
MRNDEAEGNCRKFRSYKICPQGLAGKWRIRNENYKNLLGLRKMDWQNIFMAT